MKFFCTTLLLMAMATITYAQGTAPVIPLYPNGVPNSKPTPATYIEKNGDGHASATSVPTLIPFFPEKGKATGTAVIICPGGGYSGLAIDKEGYAVAKEFNKIGITAFVLKYRLPSDLIMVDKTIGPLQDAQAAIVMIRKNAAAWGVDPAKVGIMGFSAGGHLASTAGTHFDKAVVDNKDNTSVRPDFMLLLYPVISFGEFAHKGSRNNLVGLTPTPEQIEFYSNEKQVTANTPPTFIVQAGDDKTVPVQNSLLFYEALLKNKVKTEMHLYQAGGHGFGLNNPTSKEHWFEWCAGWMNANGF
ncbi:alpha/beta hydrolase [Mucilaginibacter sp.]|uniref:alpha/beta hydrolase n=1 Tax=Mucilaginibacter sp. TaxID=1882438 RepID=UPI00261951DC|nr:alpha/beta hydrolase [Mucilaginibacter sp.]